MSYEKQRLVFQPTNSFVIKLTAMQISAFLRIIPGGKSVLKFLIVFIDLTNYLRYDKSSSRPNLISVSSVVSNASTISPF